MNILRIPHSILMLNNYNFLQNDTEVELIAFSIYFLCIAEVLTSLSQMISFMHSMATAISTKNDVYFLNQGSYLHQYCSHET